MAAIPGVAMFRRHGLLNSAGPNQARDSLIALHRSDHTAVDRRPVPSVDVRGRESVRTGSVCGEWDHLATLPVDGRDVMADLAPVGIEGEVAEQR